MSDKDTIAYARLQHATTLVQQLEAMVSKIGGYTNAEEQQLVREARAFLVDAGKREPENRGPFITRECTCAQLADGTNATRKAPCTLHPSER